MTVKHVAAPSLEKKMAENSAAGRKIRKTLEKFGDCDDADQLTKAVQQHKKWHATCIQDIKMMMKLRTATQAR